MQEPKAAIELAVYVKFENKLNHLLGVNDRN